MKNFAYRYYFSVGRQFVIDKAVPSDKNAQGELTNRIFVGDDELLPLPSVDLKKKITYRASQYENLLTNKMREKQGRRELSTTGVSETELLEIMTSFDTMKAECKDL